MKQAMELKRTIFNGMTRDQALRAAETLNDAAKRFVCLFDFHAVKGTTGWQVMAVCHPQLASTLNQSDWRALKAMQATLAACSSKTALQLVPFA